MAFTNRCFPTKVVPVWTRPFTEEQHVRVVGTYFRYSACEWEVGVADVSPDGWVGQRDVTGGATRTLSNAAFYYPNRLRLVPA